ncbi:hypothetical protein OB08_13040 [Microbacterium sp. HJ5]
MHLDFHTSPLIPDVGRAFDTEEFAARLRLMRVDSVTLFAKCHHGHLYYETDRPERHPGLAGASDLLRSQVEAARSAGVRSPLYLSVLFDEFAAAARPEWVAVDESGAPVRVETDAGPGWHVMDMSSGYADHLAAQLSDVLDHFDDADGFFFDICFDQISFSSTFNRLIERHDVAGPEARSGAARALSHDYMRRLRDQVSAGRAHDGAARSVFFNSRPRLRDDDGVFDTHDEIEALPTGGWGYTYAPYVARNVLPVQPRALGMTGRFFGSWGDSGSLHPAAALRYEALQMVALGLGVSIGDSLPASGRSHPAVTDLIADTFAYVESVQSVSSGFTRVVDIAVLRVRPSGTDVHVVDSPGAGELGALRILGASGVGFDFVAPDHDLSRYDVVVVLADVPLDPSLLERLAAVAGSGRRVLLSGHLAADGGWAAEIQGLTASPEPHFSQEFIRPVTGRTGLPDFDFAVHETVLRAHAAAETVELAHVTEPYFDRSPDRFSGHEYTPAGRATAYPAAVAYRQTLTFLFPVFEAYGRMGIPELAALARSGIDLLLPTPSVRLTGPSHLDASLLRSADDSLLLHLLSYLPARRSQSPAETVSDPVPVERCQIELRIASPPGTIVQLPEDRELAFTYVEGYVRFELSFSSGHTMVLVRPRRRPETTGAVDGDCVIE